MFVVESTRNVQLQKLGLVNGEDEDSSEFRGYIDDISQIEERKKYWEFGNFKRYDEGSLLKVRQYLAEKEDIGFVKHVVVLPCFRDQYRLLVIGVSNDIWGRLIFPALDWQIDITLVKHTLHNYTHDREGRMVWMAWPSRALNGL